MTTEAVSVPWRRAINPYVEDVEVIREGDTSGYDTVLRIIFRGGREVGAIALPHHYRSRTGPTWAYLFDCQGWTLIDVGSQGAMDALERGLGALGRRLTDLERVIITHGHQDHDGSAYDVVKASGAELWAHGMYFHLLPYDYEHGDLDGASPLHQAVRRARGRMHAWYGSRANAREHGHWVSHNQRYMERHRRILEEGLPVHAVQDGEQVGDMRLLYTPGHAVDELCISLNGAVFTGDHILPQISPHPTFKQAFPEPLRGVISGEYEGMGDHYGLACYLRSLGKVLGLDIGTTVLPAHRLFNHGRLNLRNLRRAQDIVRHHVRRLGRILGIVGEGATTVEEVTVRLFSPRKLAGGGFFPAVSEVVSHLELLADAGDIQVSEEGTVRRSGTEGFYQEIQALTGYSVG